MAAMDFLRVIKGAVDQDAKNTKEKLKETTERLKAERALMIDSKKRNYDSKNKIIDEEIEKFKSIQAVNASFGDKKPAPSEWGRVYAINNKPTEYAAMAKTFADNPQALKEYLASFSSNANFKVQGSKELLDKKYQEDVKAITLEADKQIKNARGDSFLINKILGIKKNKIDSVTQGDTNEDSKAIETAKQVAAATDTDKPFVFGEEVKYDTDVVPTAWKKAAKLGELRTKLNSDEMTKSFSKAGVSAGLNLFATKSIRNINNFVSKEKGEIVAFKGPGIVVGEHLSLLGNGALDSITDKKVYLETNKNYTEASRILNAPNVKAKVSERVNDYTVIVNPNQVFKDGNIVNIVPFSIVDVNNTLDKTPFNNKADRAKVGKAYASALKEFVKQTNRREAIGPGGKPVLDAAGNPTFEIIRPENEALNNLQTELLNLRGGSSQTSQVIQNLMKIKLGLNDKSSVTTPSPIPSPTSSVSKTMITVFDPKTKKTTSVEDTPAARKMIEQKGFKITGESKPVPSPTSTITQVEGITNYTELPRDKSIRRGNMRKQIRDLKNKNLYDTSITGPQRVELSKIQTEQRLKNRNNR
tara:strand:+ start:1568 stop:3325 length:1758 start_codon:yes stop_codon:yes gene_type:complete